MTFARFRHSQTLLLNGLVLVAGGLDTEGVSSLSSTELYDPAAGTWTTTGSLNVARGQHTATLMPNGLVAVVGGFHGPTATSELYDPATATWSLSGDMVKARAAHQTVLLPSGDILVVAGFNTEAPPSDPSSPVFDDYTLKEAEIGTLQGSEPPVITKQPKNQRVHVGETATFKVVATGTPPLTYQWTKNGSEIPGAVAAKYTTPPVAADDNGSLFDVTVSDSGGSITSRSATLFVRLVSSMITQPPDRSVPLGEVARFRVAATGKLPLIYQWLMDGAPTTGSDEIDFQNHDRRRQTITNPRLASR